VQLKVFSKTDKGRIRDGNEDSMLVYPHLPDLGNKDEDPIEVLTQGAIFAVADGMGGMQAGEIASGLVIDTLKDMLSNGFFLSEIHEKKIKGHMKATFMNAQISIEERGKKDPSTLGMGTTLVVGYIRDSNLHVAWLGDSRCYIYRKGVGLKCITRDHSFVQKFVDEGLITMDEAFDHPGSNIITRCLQCVEDNDPFPDHALLKLEFRDRILFCSDGLNTMLRDAEIGEILAADEGIRSCTELLVSSAIEKGGRDNITVILVDVI
jgi:protein phosphatase